MCVLDTGGSHGPVEKFSGVYEAKYCYEVFKLCSEIAFFYCSLLQLELEVLTRNKKKWVILYLVVTVSLSSTWTWIFSSVEYRTSAGRRRVVTLREEGREESWVVNTPGIPSLLLCLRDYQVTVYPSFYFLFRIPSQRSKLLWSFSVQ